MVGVRLMGSRLLFFFRAEISGSGPLSLVPLSPGLDDPSSTHAGTARRIANAQRAGDADAATLLSAEPMALLPGLAPSAVGAPGRSDSEWMRREDEDEELRQALCRQDGEDGIYSRDLPGACWGGQAEAPDMPLHYHAASPPPPCVPPSALNDHFLALRHSFSDPGESFACFANGACGRGGLFCPHGLGEECEHKGLVGEDCEQHEIVEGFFGRASLDGAAPRRRGGRVAASAAEPGSSQWDSNPGHLYGRASVDVAPPQRPCGLPPSFGRAFLWPGHVEPALPGPEAGFQAAEAGPAAVAPRCAPTYGLPLSGPAGVPTGGGFVKEVQHAPDGKCGSKRKSVTGERPEGQDVASKKASLSGLRSVEPARLPAEVAAKSCTTPSGRGCHREAQALLESVLFGGAVLSDLSAEVELEIRKLYLHKRPRIKGRFVRKVRGRGQDQGPLYGHADRLHPSYLLLTTWIRDTARMPCYFNHPASSPQLYIVHASRAPPHRTQLELAQLLHKFKRPIPKTKDQKTSRVSTPNSSLHGSSAALFALHSARGGNQLRQGAGASPTAAFHTEGTLPGHQSSFAPIEPAAPVRLPDMGPFAGLLGAGAAFERWHLSPADCSLDGAL